MKFRALACPPPSPGTVMNSVSMTVPDQAMSLATILERFVRNEPLDVHMYGEASRFSNVEDFDNPMNIDYEKLQYADLVEKQDYSDFLASIKNRYESAEKAKAAKAEAAKRAKEHEALVQKIRAENAAKGSSEKSAQ